MQTHEEIIRDRAIKIVNMVERDAPGYPTDERACWSTLNTVTTYALLKDRAAIYAELDKSSTLTRDEKTELLTKVLLHMFAAIDQGQTQICERYGISLEDVIAQFTTPLCLNAHLLELFDDKQEVYKQFLFFFVLALNEILLFEESFSSAFVAPEDWKNTEIRESSYQSVINSMGNLLIAQEAFGYGERYMAYALSKERIDTLAQKVDAVEKGRVTGGKNSYKSLDPLREWIKEQAKMYFDTDPDKKLKSGSVADELRKAVSDKKEQFGYLGGSIPSHTWFRDEVAKDAPMYANKKGRPKK